MDYLKKAISSSTLSFNLFLTDKRSSGSFLLYQGSFGANNLFKKMLNKITSTLYVYKPVLPGSKY